MIFVNEPKKVDFNKSIIDANRGVDTEYDTSEADFKLNKVLKLDDKNVRDSKTLLTRLELLYNIMERMK